MRTEFLLLCSVFTLANGLGCGVGAPDSEALGVAQQLQASSRRERAKIARSVASRRDEGLIIPTYFHVIESEDKAGFVTDRMLDAQLKVLTTTFAPHNISFALQNTTHTINNAWAQSTRNRQKSLALREGGYDTLNIYFETGLMRQGSVTGICSWAVPSPLTTGINGTSWSILDGCHVSPGTMPEGPGMDWAPGENSGKTATHEVGHWFGLFHVFEGESCEGDGDFVDDTPAMLGPTKGCPIGKDTCPEQEGLDPIHNYMDYSNSGCQFEFTLGQEERMHMHFNTLRKGKYFEKPSE